MIDAKEFIKSKLTVGDRDNLFNVQFLLLCYLEEGDPLPKWLEYKIGKLIEKFGFKRAEIVAAALSNQLAATTLSKSAKRQNTPEQAQIEYLNELHNHNIEKLPDNGNGSIRIMDGEFVYDQSRANMSGTKTIDAKEGNTYISFKYTEEAGGSQDSQIVDIKDFLLAANEYVSKHNNDNTFVAIVDGAYIESKITVLRTFAGHKVRVCTSNSYKVAKA